MCRFPAFALPFLLIAAAVGLASGQSRTGDDAALVRRQQYEAHCFRQWKLLEEGRPIRDDDRLGLSLLQSAIVTDHVDEYNRTSDGKAVGLLETYCDARGELVAALGRLRPVPNQAAVRLLLSWLGRLSDDQLRSVADTKAFFGLRVSRDQLAACRAMLLLRGAAETPRGPALDKIIAQIKDDRREATDRECQKRLDLILHELETLSVGAPFPPFKQLDLTAPENRKAILAFVSTHTRELHGAVSDYLADTEFRESGHRLIVVQLGPIDLEKAAAQPKEWSYLAPQGPGSGFVDPRFTRHVLFNEPVYFLVAEGKIVGKAYSFGRVKVQVRQKKAAAAPNGR